MTSLAEEGFLSDETVGVVQAVERKYARSLTLFRSVNARAVKAQYEVKVPREYLPALVAATCYMRTLTNVEAAILLLLRGMEAPARIMLRASMESLFKLKAVERDRNVVNAIVASDDGFRQKLLEKYRRIDDPKLQADLARIEPLKSETAERFKEWGVKPLSVEQMAAKADLSILYLSTYPVLSDTVHAGVRDLERHVQSVDGEIVSLHNEPTLDGLGVLFLMATEFLLLALEGFAHVLTLNLGDYCEVSRRELQALAAAQRDE
jgi:hypothetical protein